MRLQVADRWHLMENASRSSLDAVRKSMRGIRAAIGATTINPDLLTRAERLQYEGYLRREETNAAIMALACEGVPIKQIVRRTGHSRKLVGQVIRGERTDVFRVRESSIEAHLPLLDAQWASGCHNGAELLAASQSKRLSRLVTCRGGMGNASPPRRACQPRKSPKSSVSENNRPVDDNREGHTLEV
jgi:transposase